MPPATVFVGAVIFARLLIPSRLLEPVSVVSTAFGAANKLPRVTAKVSVDTSPSTSVAVNLKLNWSGIVIGSPKVKPNVPLILKLLLTGVMSK